MIVDRDIRPGMFVDFLHLHLCFLLLRYMLYLQSWQRYLCYLVLEVGSSRVFLLFGLRPLDFYAPDGYIGAVFLHEALEGVRGVGTECFRSASSSCSLECLSSLLSTGLNAGLLRERCLLLVSL